MTNIDISVLVGLIILCVALAVLVYHYFKGE
jgi:hypothetical protein